MNLLITKSIVASKLQVAIGYSDFDFQTFINEAQEFDFKPMVREDFYVDLLSKKAEPAYSKLINGGTYAFENREYQFQGIASVLSYFAFARFKLNSNAVSTTHGFVQKKTPDSEPLSLQERRNEYYEKQRQANLLFEDVKRFIERKISDYPSWNTENNCSNIQSGPRKTTVIQ